MSLESADNKIQTTSKTSEVARKAKDNRSLLLDGSSCSLEKLSTKRVQRRQRDVFESIDIVGLINEGKFSVFLVEIAQKKFAMKVFPQNPQDEGYFLNELRFASLNHPNVVKTVCHVHDKLLETPEASFKASFILTEFAPHGDFFDLNENFSSQFDEKLIRTYFHQLIEGLEYLHSQEVAHLDLKLENLLLGEDYLLKICDFDTSCSTKDSSVSGKGTKYWRAPELITGECKNMTAADIYSAGVILFAMKCQNFVPHTESKKYEGIDLRDLLWTRNEEFWNQQCRIQEKPTSFFSEEFKMLVNGMMKEKPEDRLTMTKIKSSKWYSGSTYSHEELKMKMKSLLQN